MGIDRRWRHRGAGAAGVAMLFVLTGSSLAQSPSPDPTASPDPSPSPSADVECDPVAVAEPREVLPGAEVLVRYRNFPPNSEVTITFIPKVDPAASESIAIDSTDGAGAGQADPELGNQVPFGDAVIRVASETCFADAQLRVVRAVEMISIDDNTVAPGQRVTVMASGFYPNVDVLVLLDARMGGVDCRCRLTTGRADSAGAVVQGVTIPRGISPGAHFLTAYGFGSTQRDLSLVVPITVSAGPVPPTDTE